jgi:hypothetical protein
MVRHGMREREREKERFLGGIRRGKGRDTTFLF